MLTPASPCSFATGRVQKMTMIAEGAEAKRVEEAIEERKRKMEEKQRWEGAQAFFAHDCVVVSSLQAWTLTLRHFDR